MHMKLRCPGKGGASTRQSSMANLFCFRSKQTEIACCDGLHDIIVCTHVRSVTRVAEGRTSIHPVSDAPWNGWNDSTAVLSDIWGFPSCQSSLPSALNSIIQAVNHNCDWESPYLDSAQGMSYSRYRSTFAC